MSDRNGIFAGDNPFALANDWLAEAEATEPNDANAMALATVDADGLPNARIVLLKEIEAQAPGGFVFYTNQNSAKAGEIEAAGRAAFTMHWKTLRRQIRARGRVEMVSDAQADAYFASRSVKSRLGAWASAQSTPLDSRDDLEAALREVTDRFGDNPPRPPHWGGYRIVPTEIEFWADGEARLHNRFQWRRVSENAQWTILRLNP